MNNEIKGHYNRKKAFLLRNFTKSVDEAIIFFSDQKDERFMNLSSKKFGCALGKIIPEIPYFRGYRQRMFNNMLLLTGQMLAIYRVLQAKGMENTEIWFFVINGYN